MPTAEFQTLLAQQQSMVKPQQNLDGDGVAGQG